MLLDVDVDSGAVSLIDKIKLFFYLLWKPVTFRAIAFLYLDHASVYLAEAGLRGPDVDPNSQVSDCLKFLFTARIRTWLGFSGCGMTRDAELNDCGFSLKELLPFFDEPGKYYHYLDHVAMALQAIMRLSCYGLEVDGREVTWLGHLAHMLLIASAGPDDPIGSTDSNEKIKEGFLEAYNRGY